MVFDQRRLIGMWCGKVSNRRNNRRKGGRYYRAQSKDACSYAGTRVVRAAAVAAVPGWRRVCALTHAGGGAYGAGESHRVGQRRTLPSEGQKQYPDDQPPIHLHSVLRAWINVPFRAAFESKNCTC